MTKSVEVTLVIKVAVDEEYSGADHANDIVATAKKTFAAAEVNVLTIEIASEAKPSRTGIPAASRQW